jgi:hypothetical protein
MTVKEVFDRVLASPPDSSIIVEFENIKRLESFRVQIYREMNSYKKAGGKGAIRIERDKKELTLEIAVVPEPIKVYIKHDNVITPLAADIGTREMVAKMLAEGLTAPEVVALFPDVEGADTEQILAEIAAMNPQYLKEEEEDGEDN